MSKIIGIDLGTTFSAVAHINEHAQPEIIPNADSDRLTPSVILFEDDLVTVGKIAKQNSVAMPAQIVEFVKREMGKSKEKFFREFNGKEYSAEELSALILQQLKQDAEAYFNTEITDAVITVPAYFNDSERQATIRAGEIAGLKVHRIINEPTAAAIAYGMHQSGSKSRVLVFDLGGGTFDVTIMEVDGQEMKILATNGDHRLGGKDWDDAIIVHVAEIFETEHGENPLVDLHAYQDLQASAVHAKSQLSTRNRAAITANYAGKTLRLQLTRQEFEAITSDLVTRCRGLVDVVLIEANLTREQIDTVLLIGGSTRLPMIRDMLAQDFGKPPDTSVNPDEAVAIGAAWMGALIQSEQTEERRFIGAVPAPITGIMRISDVCSHSLGMVVLDEIGELSNSTIIKKNTNIPCEISRDNYETTSPDQTEFDVIVVQGDMQDPRDCPVRDAYEIYNIPPRPAGETRLRVTFKYNASGVIEVEAEDVLSGKALPKRKKVEDIDWDSLVAPEPVPMDIALVIDCSMSMFGQEIRDARKAAVQFLDNIDPSAHVGLVSFGNPSAHIQMELTQDFAKLRRAIKNLNADGSTPMAEAIALTRKQVLVNSDNENVLILLTDGMPNDSSSTSREAELAKHQGIRMITIGVGNGVDSKYLKQVGSTPEDYYFAEESVQLESTFTTIAGRLVTESSWGGSGLMRL